MRPSAWARARWSRASRSSIEATGPSRGASDSIVPAFTRLATEGSKPEIEAAIGRAVDGAIRYVLGLYALLVAIAFLGVTKPF